MKYELIKVTEPKETWYYIVIDGEKRIAYASLMDAEDMFDLLTNKEVKKTVEVLKTIEI